MIVKRLRAHAHQPDTLPHAQRLGDRQLVESGVPLHWKAQVLRQVLRPKTNPKAHQDTWRPACTLCRDEQYPLGVTCMQLDVQPLS